MEIKTVGLASDHGGLKLKEFVIGWLKEKGYAYKDFGCYTADSCDYPDFGHPLATAVEKGECYPGIAICTTGNGINMVVNHHQGIRAALCWLPELAHLARQHNNANILSLPGRYVDEATTTRILEEFFTTDFDGGRHERRINKIPLP